MADEYNYPSREDHYLMQIAAEIRRAFSKPGTTVDPNKLRIKFVRKNSEEEISNQEKAERSKAIWMGAFGMTPDGQKISSLREKAKRRNRQ